MSGFNITDERLVEIEGTPRSAMIMCVEAKALCDAYRAVSRPVSGEVAAVVNGLAEWLLHTENCEAVANDFGAFEKPCTCGLDDAIALLQSLSSSGEPVKCETCTCGVGTNPPRPHDRSCPMTSAPSQAREALQKFVAIMESDEDGGDGVFEEKLERLLPEAKSALDGRAE